MKIQKAKNTNSLTSFEQMHLPWIIFPEFIKKNENFKVLVKIGKVNHPMTDEHFIICIRLYINGEQLECKILDLNNHSEAEFEILLEKDSLIMVRTECNLHGLWEAEEKVILYRGE